MLKLFISLMIIFLSLIMFFLIHPLSMGISILTQTLLICLISGMLIKTYWFSYILFLTFMGGLLVLFIYVSSIASNEMFKISMNMKIYMMISISIIFFMNFIFIFNMKWLNFTINSLEMNNFFNLFLFFNNENKFNLSKLYNNQTFMLMMMMVIYLFVTLIAVVKITNIFYGPLRPSYN
uniref:NADH-ubiquinone oxidoreductase chain 6 n=1 Tax=Paralipsa gularis TaxID=1915117 RepID=A0A7T0KCP1_9NEOP|nr:NADH dehydrogenase subunit 6 [Paralipsa gularis]QPK77272.1 NADH dehydrogenase subunit 6 [Paralipsa gularis]